MSRVIRIIGPGGAGKTSAGRLLADLLGWQFVDLDAEFMAREGPVAQFIEKHTYDGYVARNLDIHDNLKQALSEPTVLPLSSGFMTYSAAMGPRYVALRREIEVDPLTVLLLPSFELETCVQIIVERQLGRPYLSANRAREEQRIRERFPLLAGLDCQKFQSDKPSLLVAKEIERFVRTRL